MRTLQSNKQNDWVPISPGGHAGMRARAALATALWLAGAIAGTGGNVPEHLLRDRLGTGSALPGRINTRVQVAAKGLSDQLNAVRSILRISVAELASIFKVSRPTIYSWLRGGLSNEKNAASVREFVSAVEPHFSLFEIQAGRVSRRAIEGRASIIDLLRSGERPKDAVTRLVAILENEDAQRDRLARRLQGKSASRGAADSDVLG